MVVIFSDHALKQMVARNILEEIVLFVVQNPDKISRQDEEISIYMKLIDEPEKQYLYQVFINTAKNPPLVIASYKTSKIEKYGYSL